MPIKVIALDFDGVVVESNNIKHRAFLELFKSYPPYCEEIMAYHCAHNGIDRHEKFRHIMVDILKREYDAQLAKEWASKFSQLTLNAIIACPFVSGALDFLEFFSKKYPLYLASATPLEELKIILRSRGIDKYFKQVYGAPLKKERVLREIIGREEVAAQEVVFIGDSREDFAAAENAGVSFVARLSDNDLKDLSAKKCKDLKEVQSLFMQDLLVFQ